MSSVDTVWGMPALPWLVVATLLSGAVLVVVRGVDAIAARVLSPRIRMALYALVLVRVVLPPDFSTPLGLVGAGEAEPAAAVASAEVAGSLETPAVAVPWLSRGSRAAVEPTAGTEPVRTGDSSLPWIWVGGVGLVLGVAAIRRRDLDRIVAESRPGPAALADLGGEARVLVHPTAGPLAAGHLRKVIVLPETIVQRLPDAALHWVVAHERAHHEGHDAWFASGLTLITALAWPLLPVWLAARRVRILLEHAADERAVASSTGARRSYGRVLLDLVAEAPARPAAIGLGAYRDLRSRIAAIVRPARAPLAVQLGLASLVVGVVVACAAVPAEDELDPLPRAADCEALKRSATVAHDEAEKAGDPTRFHEALDGYDEYFAACEKDPDYADMEYYAAEASWAVAVAEHRAGHLDAAADAFSRARGLFDAAIDAGSRFTDDAAYGQHLSVRNASGWRPRDEAPPCEGCERLAFVPYDATEREILASWDRYVDVHGRPTQVGDEELLDLARLRMQHNDFVAVRPDLEELVTRYPGTHAGLSAAEMLVDALTVVWTRAHGEAQAVAGAELADWIRRIESSSTWSMDGADRLREAVPMLRAGIAWKDALAQLALAESTGDPEAYRRCAEQFEALVAAYSDHPRVVDALRRNARTCAAAGG